MSEPHVIGVSFPEAGVRREWIARLASYLDRFQVVDVDQVPSERVTVLVVGNPPGETLEAFDALRFVQSTWAGVDRLVEGAPRVPIARMVAPELTELMSEFVLASVLLLHRGFPDFRRSQSKGQWQPLSALPARRRSVGILGFGELGRPAAHLLADTGFDVAAWARRPRQDRVTVYTGEDGLHRLLGRSQILVNLLPLTRRTHGILDRSIFERLPAGASLVNAARGAHVLERDLLEALDQGALSDAVLDVFSEEPLPVGHPFWSHERVTVVPHSAAPSDPSDLAPRVAGNIERFARGEEPHFLVTAG